MDEQDYTRFSLKDMFVLVVLPRLEGIDKKLDERLDELNAKLDQKADQVVQEKLAHRVTMLEDWRNRILGALAVLGAASATAITYVVRHIHF